MSRKRSRRLWQQKSRTDGYESDAGGNIIYLKLTSPGFLGVLYGNPFGICAMTICLGIYSFSYWLGRRIVDIEV